MPHLRLIPAMLLSNGRLVKGKAFSNHEDAGNPVTTTRIYNDQMADEIIILDIDATREKRPPDLKTLKSLAAHCFVPISFGGGVSTLEIARQVLEAGADKIIVNTAALENLTFLGELTDHLGCQAVVMAIDYARTKSGLRVMTNAGKTPTSWTPLALAQEAVASGAGEIMLTCIDNEGQRCGLDLPTLQEVTRSVSAPVIAHGGIGNLDDFVDGYKEGQASAVAAGRIFQFADNNLIKVRRYLLQHDIDLRLR